MEMELIENVALLGVLFGIPITLLPWLRRQRRKGLLPRGFVSVLGVWLGLCLHRSYIGLPMSMARAQANGNDIYDGIGGNLAILMGGWLPGLISTSIVFGIWVAFVPRPEAVEASGTPLASQQNR